MRSLKYTLDIKPVDGHLQVTIPELGVTVDTTGTRRTEAVDAANRAIVDHLIQKRKNRTTRKRASVQRQSA